MPGRTPPGQLLGVGEVAGHRVHLVHDAPGGGGVEGVEAFGVLHCVTPPPVAAGRPVRPPVRAVSKDDSRPPRPVAPRGLLRATTRRGGAGPGPGARRRRRWTGDDRAAVPTAPPAAGLRPPGGSGRPGRHRRPGRSRSSAWWPPCVRPALGRAGRHGRSSSSAWAAPRTAGRTPPTPSPPPCRPGWSGTTRTSRCRAASSALVPLGLTVLPLALLHTATAARRPGRRRARPDRRDRADLSGHRDLRGRRHLRRAARPHRRGAGAAGQRLRRRRGGGRARLGFRRGPGHRHLVRRDPAAAARRARGAACRHGGRRRAARRRGAARRRLPWPCTTTRRHCSSTGWAPASAAACCCVLVPALRPDRGGLGTRVRRGAGVRGRRRHLGVVGGTDLGAVPAFPLLAALPQEPGPGLGAARARRPGARGGARRPCSRTAAARSRRRLAPAGGDLRDGRRAGGRGGRRCWPCSPPVRPAPAGWPRPAELVAGRAGGRRSRSRRSWRRPCGPCGRRTA